jgi:light-regulated signal transduction histidine kinase (bacteriophytochrome)
LNAIMGYARMLRAGMLTSDSLPRTFETIERNASSLTRMVEDILDVSRVVSGKMRLNMQPVELPLVVHDAVATVMPAAEAKHIRVDATVDPQVGPVSGDPDRLRQIVWNLLSNAVKFTPKEGRLQVRLERLNSSVEIVVSDTGIGIRPDFLPHIFERFRQADSGASTQDSGWGWRSCGIWWSCTAARCTRPAEERGKARRSACDCRYESSIPTGMPNPDACLLGMRRLRRCHPSLSCPASTAHMSSLLTTIPTRSDC